MKPQRLTLLLSLIALPLFTHPQLAQAEDVFSPTVKIIGYERFLNGQLQEYGQGSGTIISTTGQVLTNAHVVLNEETGEPLKAFAICVTQNAYNPPECRFTASLLRYDQKIDLALLEMDKTALWGNTPSSLPYLGYSHGVQPAQGSNVIVEGFSVSGGSTINLTKGQVSGFEKNNGYNYLKTDADIDAGNSGGTMTDEQGNFIGIPTYVISYYENSGRALDIVEAKKWIESGLGKKGQENSVDKNTLSQNLRAVYEANNQRKVTLKTYPGLSLNLPTGWNVDTVTSQHFESTTDTGIGYFFALSKPSVFAEKLTLEESAILLNQYPETQFLDQHEEVKIAENEALHLWGEEEGVMMHFYFLTYGYSTIVLGYGALPEDEAEIQKEVDVFLDSITFTQAKLNQNPEASQSLKEANYPFELQAPSGWKILKSIDQDYSLATAERDSDSLEAISIHYYPFSGESSYYEGVNYDVESGILGDLVLYNDTWVIDGLPANLSIYEDSESEFPTKTAIVIVQDPEYEFSFTYETKLEAFDEELKDFQAMLKTFKSKRYTNPNTDWVNFDPSAQGTYTLTTDPSSSNNLQLSDIAGHRYEKSIRNLVDLGVINGNPDGTFRPEEPVNRAAALKIILQSLRAQQEVNGEETFVMPVDFNAFPDVPKDIWFATYVAEGLDKGIISGYPDGTFKGANTLNLAEALKMTLEAHDVTVWQGTTDPWYKKYFDAAYSLYLLPEDLKEPAKLLTKAELAYIVDQLISW